MLGEMTERREGYAMKERRMTVLNRMRGYALVPEIRLAGTWLELAGFTPGTRVKVAVRPGRLVVTVAAPPIPRNEDATLVEQLMADVERLRALSLRKRRRKY
jgi:hypothetical protein